MTRPTQGRHRVPRRLTSLMLASAQSGKSTAALAASGGLLAVSVLAAAAAWPRDDSEGTAEIAAAAPTGSTEETAAHRAAGAFWRPAPEPAAAAKPQAQPLDEPAKAAAAPAGHEQVLERFGVLGFTGVTPKPEPAPEPEPAPQPEPETQPEPAPQAAAVPVEPAASEPDHEHPEAGTDERTQSSASRSQPRASAPEANTQTSPPPAPAPQRAAAPPSGAGEAAIAWAYNNLGLPYEWGSAGPNTYDCSGFTKTAFAAAGVGLPHGSEAQYHATSRVPLSQIQRGDLLFYSSNGAPSGIYHVAIYLGDGQVIHALRDWSGWDGSKVQSIDIATGLMGAGRR